MSAHLRNPESKPAGPSQQPLQNSWKDLALTPFKVLRNGLKSVQSWAKEHDEVAAPGFVPDDVDVSGLSASVDHAERELPSIASATLDGLHALASAGSGSGSVELGSRDSSAALDNNDKSLTLRASRKGDVVVKSAPALPDAERGVLAHRMDVSSDSRHEVGNGQDAAVLPTADFLDVELERRILDPAQTTQAASTSSQLSDSELGLISKSLTDEQLLLSIPNVPEAVEKMILQTYINEFYDDLVDHLASPNNAGDADVVFVEFEEGSTWANKFRGTRNGNDEYDSGVYDFSVWPNKAVTLSQLEMILRVGFGCRHGAGSCDVRNAVQDEDYEFTSPGYNGAANVTETTTTGTTTLSPEYLEELSTYFTYNTTENSHSVYRKEVLDTAAEELKAYLDQYGDQLDADGNPKRAQLFVDFDGSSDWANHLRGTKSDGTTYSNGIYDFNRSPNSEIDLDTLLDLLTYGFLCDRPEGCLTFNSLQDPTTLPQTTTTTTDQELDGNYGSYYDSYSHGGGGTDVQESTPRVQTTTIASTEGDDASYYYYSYTATETFYEGGNPYYAYDSTTGPETYYEGGTRSSSSTSTATDPSTRSATTTLSPESFTSSETVSLFSDSSTHSTSLSRTKAFTQAVTTLFAGSGARVHTGAYKSSVAPITTAAAAEKSTKAPLTTVLVASTVIDGHIYTASMPVSTGDVHLQVTTLAGKPVSEGTALLTSANSTVSALESTLETLQSLADTVSQTGSETTPAQTTPAQTTVAAASRSTADIITTAVETIRTSQQAYTSSAFVSSSQREASLAALTTTTQEAFHTAQTALTSVATSLRDLSDANTVAVTDYIDSTIMALKTTADRLSGLTTAAAVSTALTDLSIVLGSNTEIAETTNTAQVTSKAIKTTMSAAQTLFDSVTSKMTESTTTTTTTPAMTTVAQTTVSRAGETTVSVLATIAERLSSGAYTSEADLESTIDFLTSSQAELFSTVGTLKELGTTAAPLTQYLEMTVTHLRRTINILRTTPAYATTAGTTEAPSPVTTAQVTSVTKSAFSQLTTLLEKGAATTRARLSSRTAAQELQTTLAAYQSLSNTIIQSVQTQVTTTPAAEARSTLAKFERTTAREFSGLATTLARNVHNCVRTTGVNMDELGETASTFAMLCRELMTFSEASGVNTTLLTESLRSTMGVLQATERQLGTTIDESETEDLDDTTLAARTSVIMDELTSRLASTTALVLSTAELQTAVSKFQEFTDLAAQTSATELTTEAATTEAHTTLAEVSHTTAQAITSVRTTLRDAHSTYMSAVASSQGVSPEDTEAFVQTTREALSSAAQAFSDSSDQLASTREQTGLDTTDAEHYAATTMAAIQSTLNRLSQVSSPADVTAVFTHFTTLQRAATAQKVTSQSFQTTADAVRTIFDRVTAFSESATEAPLTTMAQTTLSRVTDQTEAILTTVSNVLSSLPYTTAKELGTTISFLKTTKEKLTYQLSTLDDNDVDTTPVTRLIESTVAALGTTVDTLTATSQSTAGDLTTEAIASEMTTAFQTLSDSLSSTTAGIEASIAAQSTATALRSTFTALQSLSATVGDRLGSSTTIDPALSTISSYIQRTESQLTKATQILTDSRYTTYGDSEGTADVLGQTSYLLSTFAKRLTTADSELGVDTTELSRQLATTAKLIGDTTANIYTSTESISHEDSTRDLTIFATELTTLLAGLTSALETTAADIQSTHLVLSTASPIQTLETALSTFQTLSEKASASFQSGDTTTAAATTVAQTTVAAITEATTQAITGAVTTFREAHESFATTIAGSTDGDSVATEAFILTTKEALSTAEQVFRESTAQLEETRKQTGVDTTDAERYAATTMAALRSTLDALSSATTAAAVTEAVSHFSTVQQATTALQTSAQSFESTTEALSTIVETLSDEIERTAAGAVTTAAAVTQAQTTLSSIHEQTEAILTSISDRLRNTSYTSEELRETTDFLSTSADDLSQLTTSLHSLGVDTTPFEEYLRSTVSGLITTRNYLESTLGQATTEARTTSSPQPQTTAIARVVSTAFDRLTTHMMKTTVSTQVLLSGRTTKAVASTTLGAISTLVTTVKDQWGTTEAARTITGVLESTLDAFSTIRETIEETTLQSEEDAQDTSATFRTTAKRISTLANQLSTIGPESGVDTTELRNYLYSTAATFSSSADRLYTSINNFSRGETAAELTDAASTVSAVFDQLTTLFSTVTEGVQRSTQNLQSTAKFMTSMAPVHSSTAAFEAVLSTFQDLSDTAVTTIAASSPTTTAATTAAATTIAQVTDRTTSAVTTAIETVRDAYNTYLSSVARIGSTTEVSTKAFVDTSREALTTAQAVLVDTSKALAATRNDHGVDTTNAGRVAFSTMMVLESTIRSLSSASTVDDVSEIFTHLTDQLEETTAVAEATEAARSTSAALLSTFKHLQTATDHVTVELRTGEATTAAARTEARTTLADVTASTLSALTSISERIAASERILTTAHTQKRTTTGLATTVFIKSTMRDLLSASQAMKEMLTTLGQSTEAPSAQTSEAVSYLETTLSQLNATTKQLASSTSVGEVTQALTELSSALSTTSIPNRSTNVVRLTTPYMPSEQTTVAFGTEKVPAATSLGDFLTTIAQSQDLTTDELVETLTTAIEETSLTVKDVEVTPALPQTTASAAKTTAASISTYRFITTNLNGDTTVITINREVDPTGMTTVRSSLDTTDENGRGVSEEQTEHLLTSGNGITTAPDSSTSILQTTPAASTEGTTESASKAVTTIQGVSSALSSATTLAEVRDTLVTELVSQSATTVVKVTTDIKPSTYERYRDGSTVHHVTATITDDEGQKTIVTTRVVKTTAGVITTGLPVISTGHENECFFVGDYFTEADMTDEYREQLQEEGGPEEISETIYNLYQNIKQSSDLSPNDTLEMYMHTSQDPHMDVFATWFEMREENRRLLLPDFLKVLTCGFGCNEESGTCGYENQASSGDDDRGTTPIGHTLDLTTGVVTEGDYVVTRHSVNTDVTVARTGFPDFSPNATTLPAVSKQHTVPRLPATTAYTVSVASLLPGTAVSSASTPASSRKTSLPGRFSSTFMPRPTRNSEVVSSVTARPSTSVSHPRTTMLNGFTSANTLSPTTDLGQCKVALFNWTAPEKTGHQFAHVMKSKTLADLGLNIVGLTDTQALSYLEYALPSVYSGFTAIDMTSEYKDGNVVLTITGEMKEYVEIYDADGREVCNGVGYTSMLVNRTSYGDNGTVTRVIEMPTTIRTTLEVHCCMEVNEYGHLVIDSYTMKNSEASRLWCETDAACSAYV